MRQTRTFVVLALRPCFDLLPVAAICSTRLGLVHCSELFGIALVLADRATRAGARNSRRAADPSGTTPSSSVSFAAAAMIAASPVASTSATSPPGVQRADHLVEVRLDGERDLRAGVDGAENLDAKGPGGRHPFSSVVARCVASTTTLYSRCGAVGVYIR